jgi:hypothetical protein
LGHNGIGKSFILNLLLFLSAADPNLYESKSFRDPRARLEAIAAELSDTEDDSPVKEPVKVAQAYAHLKASSGTVRSSTTVANQATRFLRNPRHRQLASRAIVNGFPVDWHVKYVTPEHFAGAFGLILRVLNRVLGIPRRD